MRSTRTRTRQSATWTSCSPTRPRARWRGLRPTEGSFAHAPAAFSRRGACATVGPMTVALIVAAGGGERLRAGVPKALVHVAGRPLLQWSLDAIAAVPGMQQIVVALPQGTRAPPGVSGVAGGAVRSDSVRRALAACAEGDPVLVHDAARPLVTAELAAAVLAALAADGTADAAVAAAPVSDTIK